MRRKMETAKKTKRLAKPTKVFNQKAKKPEPDDTPGRMRGGPTAGAMGSRHRSGARKRLMGRVI